jgi:hypothetical protein
VCALSLFQARAFSRQKKMRKGPHARQTYVQPKRKFRARRARLGPPPPPPPALADSERGGLSAVSGAGG